VVKFGQERAGFVVDELHGEHQTVIKPLGKMFEKLKGITGATVLGDGNVALILDVQGLIEAAIGKRKRKPALLH
jgi:two-component system chemotaxis sensor kinase CheA